MANPNNPTTGARIIKDGLVQSDPWKVLKLNEGETPACARLPVGPLLVPVSVWRVRRACLIAREYEHGWPLGVWLAADEDPELITRDIDDFTVIGIEFNKFTDGRGYSTARLLRERYGYTGELRAIGDILRDQLFFLRRVGFNAFSVRADKNIDAALAGLYDFTGTYQSAVDPGFRLYRRETVAPIAAVA